MRATPYANRKSGSLPQRIERLTRPNGELDSMLAKHIHGDQSTIAQTLAKHIGEQSPIFKLLSPKQSNAHLQVPGLFVHVEGRRMPKQAVPAPGRVHKGWIRTTLAILLEPALVNAPYRTLAGHANVALGTVASCMNDLIRRALLVDGKRGRTLVDYEALVALWVQAYVEGLRPGLELRRFQMRADDKQTVWTRLWTVLTARAQPWALTGADAAERRTHFFRAEETEIYAPVGAFDDRELQRALLVQPAVRSGNLWVIEPPIPLALPANTHDIPMAADLLAYAELRHRGTAQALEAAALLLPNILDHAAH